MKKLYAQLVLRMIRPALCLHAESFSVSIGCGIASTTDTQRLANELRRVDRKYAGSLEPIPTLFSGSGERGSWSLSKTGALEIKPRLADRPEKSPDTCSNGLSDAMARGDIEAAARELSSLVPPAPLSPRLVRLIRRSAQAWTHSGRLSRFVRKPGR